MHEVIRFLAKWAMALGLSSLIGLLLLTGISILKGETLDWVQTDALYKTVFITIIGGWFVDAVERLIDAISSFPRSSTTPPSP